MAFLESFLGFLEEEGVAPKPLDAANSVEEGDDGFERTWLLGSKDWPDFDSIRNVRKHQPISERT